jgi:predicted PurR-regulated permease PerM
MTRKIEIHERTIVFAIALPLFLYFLWIMQETLFSLLIAFILMSALRPLVEYLTTKRIPRTPSVFIVFILFLLFFGSLVSLIIPPIVTETTTLVRNLPGIVENLNPELRRYIDINSVSQYVPTVTNNIFSILGNLFSNLLFLVTTMFFTLYFLLERDLVRRVLKPYLSAREVDHYASIADKVERRLTGWFWGQITLMTFIGIITFIGLNLLGVRYALPLAVLAGMFEVVPNIGPVIAAIPAVTIGFADSSFTGFSVLALAFVIQQLENAVIVPFIMRRAVGVNPILTLVSLLVGGKIGGVLGVLLSIPLLIVGETIVHEILVHYRKEQGTKKESLVADTPDKN